MSDDLWIVVPNWDKFQHYKDRTPPWIKLYTELNSDGDWGALTLSARGLLVTIWIEYARSRGVLEVSSLRRFCTNKGESRHLLEHVMSLNHAGYIRLVASKPLAQSREEKEKKVLSVDTRKPSTTTTDPPRVNAGAYKPFTDQNKELFDEEAFIAEVSRKAAAKGWVPPS